MAPRHGYTTNAARHLTPTYFLLLRRAIAYVLGQNLAKASPPPRDPLRQPFWEEANMALEKLLLFVFAPPRWFFANVAWFSACCF